jgi:PTS system nitrogen regulatory IIA component
MDIGDLLAPEGIIPTLEASSKKQVLQDLAARAAQMASLEEREIFDALLHRERLGSTALGRGVAIPHVRLRPLDGILTIFARLKEPIDFESPDGEPVDLIFLLLAPDHAGGDHLKALARISRLVREPLALEGLRAASDVAALRRVLTIPLTSHAA